MSLVVSTSMQALAISKGLQCLCLMRYPSSFGVVAELFWFVGLETRAQYAMRSWMLSSPLTDSPEWIRPEGWLWEMRRACKIQFSYTLRHAANFNSACKP